MHIPRVVSVLTCLSLLAGSARADDPIRLREAFAPGYQYRVNSRVELTGKLTLPAEKGAQPKSLVVSGKSAIEYDERILALDKSGQVERTVRLFHKMDFQRKVGDQTQQHSLRPEVKRMVILRHNQMEVPFSPDSALMWGEIDLVRTDVFTPAMTGLLPANAVKQGDRWQVSQAATQELTDFDKINEGSLTCTFESITEVARRKHARVAIKGTIRGLGEDGPGLHNLEGFFLFDLTSNHLSYLSLKGSHSLLDSKGKEMGKVEGNFTLTRQPQAVGKEISEAGMRGVATEPNDDNTQLLFDNPEMGLRFLHPRRWRVSIVAGKQVTLAEARGNGVVITLDPKAPTAAQFLKEATKYLTEQKATIVRTENPRQIQQAPKALDWFGLEVDMAKQRLWLDYWVVRQNQGGATIAARLGSTDLAAMQRDVQRIVRSVAISKAP